MATRKKKDSVTLDMPGTTGSAKIVTKSPKVKAIAGKWPKIDIGTHLTVTTYEDGTTLLEWDDEALQRECEAAIASVENK